DASGQAQQRGLADAVTAAYPANLTRAQSQTDVVQHGRLGTFPAVIQVLELENRNPERSGGARLVGKWHRYRGRRHGGRAFHSSPARSVSASASGGVARSAVSRHSPVVE